MPVRDRTRLAVSSLILALTALPAASAALGPPRPPAQESVVADLKALAGGRGWTVLNRAAAVTEADGRTVAELDGRPGDGMARLEGPAFTTGTIECDLLGRSAPVQGSFLGIAFGVRDAGTYEAVYLRPFNFRAEDAGRRSHSVQYIRHPEWTWGRLRQERPGLFEAAIEPPPDGDAWHRVRIVVGKARVAVYLDDAASPCLDVERLGAPEPGAVALWVGNNSPGKFANLKIRPLQEEP